MNCPLTDLLKVTQTCLRRRKLA